MTHHSKKGRNKVDRRSGGQKTRMAGYPDEDNGEGFEPRQLRRLWLPFSSGKNTFLNWGIGLNQARKIMSAHLGHIDVKSKRGKYAVIQTAFLRNL